MTVPRIVIQSINYFRFFNFATRGRSFERHFSKLAGVFVSIVLGRNLCKSNCAGTLKFYYDFFLARNFLEILQLGRAITHRRTPLDVIMSLEKVRKINCASGSKNRVKRNKVRGQSSEVLCAIEVSLEIEACFETVLVVY